MDKNPAQQKKVGRWEAHNRKENRTKSAKVDFF